MSSDFDTLFVWSDHTGQASPKPEIWQSARLYLRHTAPENWQALRLLCQHCPLPLHRDAQGHIWANWPAAEAGYYLLQLDWPERPSWVSTVFIGARYLNTRQWLHLLQDLRQGLPARLLQAWSHTGQVPTVTAAGLQLSPQEAWHWLQQSLTTGPAGPGFLKLLQAVPPVTALRPHTALLPLARSRLRQWPAALLTQAPENLAPHHVVQALQLQSGTGPEAAFVAGVVHQILSALAQLQQDLQAQGNGALRAPIQQLQQGLQQIWQRHPWRHLSPLKTPPDDLYRLLGLPLYRTALGLWQGLRQGFWPDWQHRVRQAYNNLGLLYQYWCLLQCMAQVLEAAQAHGWEALLLQPPRQQGQMVLKLQKGPETLSIWHEHSFGETGPVRSLSRQQRPDITLIHQLKAQYTLWVFEVKFRTAGNQPLKIDLDRLHAYRDALRDKQGQTVVRQAVLLYPGPTQTAQPLLQAWQTRPGEALEWPLSNLIFG